MSDRSKIAVALSGGVDSGVAAALLAEQTYEVIAITLRLRPDEAREGVPSEAAIDRARRLSEKLGLPFRLIDAEETFRREVVDYFIAEYAAGRTPNPCVPCNRFVRFDLLMERSRALGADALATGHYARVRRTDRTYQLLRGLDPVKDQSYFLHALTQEQLAHVIFPLGELTKEEVRKIADERSLPVAKQAESQDVCFLAGRDYRQFLKEHASDILQPGPIRDRAGKVLGRHEGVAAYTIGQRKGLGISAPEPLYVLAIRPEENALIVGTADELGQETCFVERMHYINGDTPRGSFDAEAQIRYRARPACVTVTPLSGKRTKVRFEAPQRDITPGQFLVLYEADVVLGGGVICKAQNSML